MKLDSHDIIITASGTSVVSLTLRSLTISTAVENYAIGGPRKFFFENRKIGHFELVTTHVYNGLAVTDEAVTVLLQLVTAEGRKMP